MLILTSVLLYSSLLQGKTLGLMYGVDEMWVLTTLSCVCPRMFMCMQVCGVNGCIYVHMYVEMRGQS